MNIIIAYFSLIIAQISIFFYLKSYYLPYQPTLGLIQLLSTKSNHKKSGQAGFEKIEKKYIVEAEPETVNQMLLSKNLKHLEFIAQFESYLDAKNSEKFSAEFLQEFEDLKREAQMTTIKTTQRVYSNLELAA